MHLPLRRARASQSFRDELGEVKSRLKTARFGFPGKPGLEAKTKSRDEIFMSRLGANKTLTQWAAEGSGLWAKQVPAGPRGGGQPSGRPGYLKAYEYFFMQSIPLGKWSISCYISKQGCHSHPWFRPSKCEFLSPKSTQEEQYLQSSSCSLWVSTEGKCRILAPDCWDAYEGNDFSVQPVNPKENLSWIFIGRTNSLATWCEELIHWIRPWCREKLKAGGEGDDRGWDIWMASPSQWTWVWASSRSSQWTRKPGVLQYMGSQRVRHFERLNWTEPNMWQCLCLAGSKIRRWTFAPSESFSNKEQ